MVALVVVACRTLKVSLSYILIIATMKIEVKPQGTNHHQSFALLFKDEDKQYALKRNGNEITTEVRNCIIFLI